MEKKNTHTAHNIDNQLHTNKIFVQKEHFLMLTAPFFQKKRSNSLTRKQYDSTNSK